MNKKTLLVLLSTLLIVSLTVSAVLSEPIMDKTQQKDQDCGENCDPEECEPKEHDYNHKYLDPGPYGPKLGNS